MRVSKQSKKIDGLTAVIRAGARKLIAQTLDAEVVELLAGHADQRDVQGRTRVVRSGHHPKRDIQTGIGPVTVRLPKARSRKAEPVTIRSVLVPPYVHTATSLEAALPWLYLNGISTGEMQGALEALVGPEAKGLSASAVSRLKQPWREEYDEWRQRRLDTSRWVYIWADSIYSGLRAERLRRYAFVVIGVNACGEKPFLAIEDAIRVSTQNWRVVLLTLKERGMNAPELAIGDGAMGFWGALEQVYPTTRQQPCRCHKTRNVLKPLPKSVHPKGGQVNRI